MSEIVISGYYGFKNGGDDALLLAMVNSLKGLKKDVTITVLSMNPSDTRQLCGTAAVNRFNFFRVFWEIWKCKLLISGGGSLIQDSTSRQSLLYYLGIIYMAKLLKKPVMLYANGIGPLRRKASRRDASWVLNMCDVITLREPDSASELRSLHVTQPFIKVTADPIFTLKKGSFNPFEGLDYAIISVRRWHDAPQDFCESMADLCDHLSRRYKILPVILPMQYPADLEISEKIASKMKTSYRIVKARQEIGNLLKIISQGRFVVGMRLHALLFALAEQVPMLPIVYDPKITGCLKYAGLADGIPVDLVNEVRLIEAVDRLMDKIANNRIEFPTEALKKSAEENAELAIKLLTSGELRL